MPCNFLERGLQLNGLRLSCVSDTNSQHNHGHHITNMPCNFLERGLQVNGLRLSCVCDTVKSTNPQISLELAIKKLLTKGCLQSHNKSQTYL